VAGTITLTVDGGTALTPLSLSIEAGGLTIAGQTLTGTWTATVDWDAPTLNTNGDSFDNSTNDRTLSGYRIYYGTSEAQVLAGTSSVQNVAAGTTIYQFSGLTSGTWHFRVVAYDGDGDESNTGASATTYTKVIA
jgi:hypothetical protein